jgi:hypothetical protein
MIFWKYKFWYLVPVALFFIIFFYERYIERKFAENWYNLGHLVSADSLFEFKRGDILVRPNMSWLPGSLPVPGGRKYGHVAVVVEGSVGSTAEGALKKARVVEALFYDQKTKSFLLKGEDQIREESAWVSFGSKFKGMRYRLRVPLTEKQSENICIFLRSQLNARYNILSLKHSKKRNAQSIIATTNRKTWQCATLTWVSFFISTGLDVDGNGGVLIFPSDIIGSQIFAQDSNRICF